MLIVRGVGVAIGLMWAVLACASEPPPVLDASLLPQHVVADLGRIGGLVYQNGELRFVDEGKGMLTRIDPRKPAAAVTIPMQEKGFHVSSLGGLALLPNGYMLVGAKRDDFVQIRDAKGKARFRFGSSGSRDSELKEPSAVAASIRGRVYVAESNNDRISVFTPEGFFLFSFGNANPDPLYALSGPKQVAVDGKERIYVLESGRGGRISIFGAMGNELKQFSVADLKKYFQGGQPFINAIAVSADGRVFMADRRSGQIAVVDLLEDKLYTVFGSNGSGRGQFKNVDWLAFDGKQELAISDTGNKKIEIFRFSAPFPTPAPGKPYLSSVRFKGIAKGVCSIGYPYHDGQTLCLDAKHRAVSVLQANGKQAVAFPGKFKKPLYAAFDDEYVAILDDESVKVYAPDGRFQFAFGKGGMRSGEFKSPQGIALGRNIYVADTGNRRVQMFSRNGVYVREIETGKGDSVKLRQPVAVAVDAKEQIFIADQSSGKVLCFSSDGRLRFAIGHDEASPQHFEEIHDLAIGADGYLYILAKTKLNRHAIRVYDGENPVLSFGQELVGSNGKFSDNVMLGPDHVASTVMVVDRRSGMTADFDVLHMPKAVKGVQLAGDSEKLVVSWSNVGQAGLKFRVYGASEAGGDFLLLGETGESSLSVPRADHDVFLLKVAAVSKQGVEGPMSEPVGDTFSEALRLFASGDYQKSNDAFRAILDKNPNHPGALEHLGRGLIRLDAADEAVQHFRKLAEIPGYQTKAYNLHAEALLQGNQWLTARNIILEAEKSGLADAKSYSLCAEALLKLGDVLGGVQCLEKSTKLEPGNSVWHLELAMAYQALGAGDKRAAELQKAVQLAGKDAGTWMALAATYHKLGIKKDAEQCYRKAMSLDASGVVPRLQLARMYLEQKNIKGARQLALELSSLDEGAANYILGEIAFAEGKTEQTLIYLAQAGKSKYAGVYVWQALDRAYEKSGNIEGRKTALEQAVQADPLSFESQFKLATVCAKLADHACARTHFAQAVTIEPRNFDAQYGLAKAAQEAGDYAEAEKAGKVALSINGKNARIYMLMAKIEAGEAHVSEAVDYLKSALKLEPTNATLHMQFAETYMLNQLYDLAQKHAEQAVSLAPKNPAPLALLGEMYLARQIYDPAIEHLTKAVELSGDATEYRQRLNYAYLQKKTASSQGGKAAGIVMEGLAFEKVFSAAYKQYANTPIGSVRLRNASGVTFENVKVSFQIKGYMDFPTTTTVPSVPANQSIEVKLKASFNNNILSIDEETGVQTEVVASYFSLGREQQSQLTQPLVIYGKNAMLWANIDMVGAFVTPKDEPLKVFARQAINQYQPKSGPLNSQVAQAMTLFQVLSASGMKYQVDPNNPYSKLEASRVDTVQFPRETLMLRSGDCDDLSVLLASAFESLGIETALLDVPGHLLLMFNTQVPAEARDTLSLNDELLVLHKGKVWIPIEATLIATSFSEAWVEGARKYRKYSASNKLKAVYMEDAWKGYAPVTLPPASRNIDLPDKAQVVPGLKREWSIISAKALERQSLPYVTMLQLNPKDDEARIKLAIVYAQNGVYELAETELKKVLDGKPRSAQAVNNLGNIYYLDGKYDLALQQYEKAVTLEPKNADMRVNIAMVYYKRGDVLKATEAFNAAVRQDKKVGERYAHFAALLSK